MKIESQSIIIVGGGAAGFMTAAVLAKHFQGSWNIKCIHSSKMGFIGVGESYNDLIEFKMNEYLHSLVKEG